MRAGGIDGLQFDPGVLDLELPVDPALSGVDVVLPGGRFRSQQVDRPEPAAGDALTGHRA